VKLIVPVPDRDPISETARLVGSPPVPRAPVEPDAPGPKDLAALSLEKEQLEIALRVQTTESEELAQRLDSLEAIEKTRAAPVAAVPQPPPPRPAPPKPVLLEQRPEATSTTGAPSVRSAAGASPAYAGPASGRLIWTGVLGTGRVVSIQGRQPSTGSLSGQFPGVPIRVRAYPAQLSSNRLTIYTSNTAHSGAGVTEVPGPQNSWTGTTYKYAPELAGTVELVQVPREQNSWTGAALRAVGPNVSVIVLEWERLR
jgi:hypothetical protein